MISQKEDEIILNRRKFNELDRIIQKKIIMKSIQAAVGSTKGVEKVKVLITYSETEKVVPIYNESSSKSSTAEKDNDGRRKNNRKL